MAAIRKLVSAEQLEGERVVGAHGEDLGKIKDILVEAASSQIVYAIIAYGGLFGGKLFAVPWDVLKYNAGHNAYVLDIPEEKMKDAPAFDRASLQDIADARWAEPLHKYYGSEASWYTEPAMASALPSTMDDRGPQSGPGGPASASVTTVKPVNVE